MKDASSCRSYKRKLKKSRVTSEIVMLIDQKEKAYKKWDKNRKDPNLKKTYKDHERQIKNKISVSKEEYENNLLDKYNQKKLWHFVN